AQGDLPWRLSDDLKRFKQLTMGKPIIMGRKTYESIGRPLPGRQNIVITRQPNFAAPGCDVVMSPEAAIEAAGDAEEIMVIGGSHVYGAFLPMADRIYLTRVRADVDGDAYLPEIDNRQWVTTSAESRSADENNDFDVEYTVLDRLSTESRRDSNEE
ncbi:MAG: dihydrofolate reductase, partial [Gammaproteobacteria bacterium]|nr:dihydrofolate reductase [Gammaproteobacteria bacterium]